MLRVSGHWGGLVASPGARVGCLGGGLWVWGVAGGFGGAGMFSRGCVCGACLGGRKDYEIKKCEIKGALFGNSLAIMSVPYL